MTHHMTRRRLLAAAPAAAAAAVIPQDFAAFPSTAAQAANLPLAENKAENPDLVRIGALTPDVFRRYYKAYEAERGCWKAWAPLWPVAPDSIVDEFAGPLSPGEPERDLAGRGITRPGRKYVLKVCSPQDMRGRISTAKEMLERKRITKTSAKFWRDEMARAELGLQELPPYRAECERIQQESGYAALAHELAEATDAVFVHARAVASLECNTLEGLRIKAEALSIINMLSAHDRWRGVVHVSKGEDPGAQLAFDVMRLLGRAQVAA